MINGGIRHVMKVNFVALIFPHYFYLQCTHSVFAWLIREYKLYNLQIPFIYCKHIDCLLWNATEHDVHVLHVWHRDSQKNVRYCTWTEQALALHCFSYATVCGAEVSCVVTSEKILPPLSLLHAPLHDCAYMPLKPCFSPHIEALIVFAL